MYLYLCVISMGPALKYIASHVLDIIMSFQILSYQMPFRPGDRGNLLRGDLQRVRRP